MLFIIQRNAKFFHPGIESFGGYLKLFGGFAFVAIAFAERLSHFSEFVQMVVVVVNNRVKND